MESQFVDKKNINTNKVFNINKGRFGCFIKTMQSLVIQQQKLTHLKIAMDMIVQKFIRTGRKKVDCLFMRSEEHTSELQSRGHLVCRLLLEKKKKSNQECKIDTNHSHS